MSSPEIGLLLGNNFVSKDHCPFAQVSQILVVLPVTQNPNVVKLNFAKFRCPLHSHSLHCAGWPVAVVAVAVTAPSSAAAEARSLSRQYYAARAGAERTVK